MKIDLGIHNSVILNYLKRLFVDNNLGLFKNSLFLKSFNIINNYKISLVFLILSIVCYWYEVFFTSIGFGFIERFNFAAIFLVLSLLFCDKKQLKSTLAIRYLMVFSVILFLSSILAALNGLTLNMLASGMLLFCQFIIAFVITSTYKQKRILLDLFIVISLPLIIMGLYQGIFNVETSRLWVSASENLIDNRAYGFFGSPNVLGSVVMLSVIAAMFLWLKYKRWYYLPYLIGSGIVLYYTFSRSAWIALLAGIFVALFIYNWKLIKFTPTLLLLLLIPSIRQRLSVATSEQYLVDAAIDGRIWSMNNSLEILNTSIILGTGPGSYGGQTAVFYDSPVYLKGMQNGYVPLAYTDNQWIQILTQTGVIGALSIACFFVSFFINCLIEYIKSKDYIILGLLAATVALFVNGLFANIWEFGAVSVFSGAYLGLGVTHEENK